MTSSKYLRNIHKKNWTKPWKSKDIFYAIRPCSQLKLWNRKGNMLQPRIEWGCSKSTSNSGNYKTFTLAHPLLLKKFQAQDCNHSASAEVVHCNSKIKTCRGSRELLWPDAKNIINDIKNHFHISALNPLMNTLQWIPRYYLIPNSKLCVRLLTQNSNHFIILNNFKRSCDNKT